MTAISLMYDSFSIFTNNNEGSAEVLRESFIDFYSDCFLMD